MKLKKHTTLITPVFQAKPEFFTLRGSDLEVFELSKVSGLGDVRGPMKKLSLPIVYVKYFFWHVVEEVDFKHFLGTVDDSFECETSTCRVSFTNFGSCFWAIEAI